MISMTGFAQEQPGSQAVLDNIHARKSVRSYTDEPVMPEQVETLLRAAMAAPSGKNVQPWRFVVVTRPETKKKLAVGFNKMIATAPVAIVIGTAAPTKTGQPTAPPPLRTSCWRPSPWDWAPCGRPATLTTTGCSPPSRRSACPTMSRPTASSPSDTLPETTSPKTNGIRTISTTKSGRYCHSRRPQGC